MNCVLIIPVYNPTKLFLQTLRDLQDTAETRQLSLIVVNDGSQKELALFRFPEMKGVTLLSHPVNLGKGAAIKTALQYLQLNRPEVTHALTLDGDFQHRAKDVSTVLAVNTAEQFVIGAREFSTENVPIRSYIGNQFTRFVLFLLSGKKLKDTQSGLRRYGRGFFTLISNIESNRFEFEMDVIMLALKTRQNVFSVGVGTSYIEGNRSSHFNPFFDSMRIYFVLLRYGLSSIAAAVLDIILFSLMIYSGVGKLPAHFISRTLGGAFNFVNNHRLVFRSRSDILASLLKYTFLLYLSGCCSYFLLTLMHDEYGMNLFSAKIIAELLMFSLNFLIQRIFIF